MADRQIGQFCYYNVGGCFFSIPRDRLTHLQDSLVFKDNSDRNASRWFIDRDGCTFRHVFYYLQTGKLATSCTSELNILYELTAGLGLTSLLQALENLQSGKHYLRARSVDLQATERATLNYWKTRICNKKQPEPIASPVSSAHDAVPLGLVGTPLVDGDEEVLYCFIPMEQVRLHPHLVTPHNLLWLCDSVAIIECDSPLFRFIANFLQTGKILLPEQFNDHERLNQEAKVAGMTGFIKALHKLHEVSFDGGDHPAVSEPSTPQRPQPLYIITFDLLVRYQDSALGQLCVDSNLEGSKLHMSGNGVVFQHVENWLGTCRLPLTVTGSEVRGLCEFLDKQDEAYFAFKEAVWEFLLRSRTTGGSFTSWPWSASVATFTVNKVVKVYVGTHWYATVLKTLLKYPELLSSPRKTSWIVFGKSLLVKGDGQMFRHILNFLRCGRLLLPSEFREWPLLCQEIQEFDIPALYGALEDCSDYRAWLKSKEAGNKSSSSSSSAESPPVYDEYERRAAEISYGEESMDPSHIQWQDSKSEEDPFIWVDEDIHRPEDIDGAESLRDILLKHTGEGSDVSTEGAANSNQLPSDSTGNNSSDRSIQRTSSATASDFSAPLNNVVKTEQPAPERTAAGAGEASASLQRMMRRTREDAGRLSSPLQRLARMVGDMFRDRGGRRAEAGAGGTAAAAAAAAVSGGPTPDSLPADPLPAQALTRLSALTVLLGGASGGRLPTQRASGAGRTPAKPYAVTRKGGEAGRWSRPALRGCVFPVRGCVLPVRGGVVRVDHPAVLGRGEPGGHFTQSIVYTGSSRVHNRYGAKEPRNARRDDDNVAFACFSLSYEEMAYGRQCHAFLTGVILDSVRLEDSKDCTLKIANLVYFLWTGQTKVEDFVSELMRIFSPEQQRQSSEQLQRWLQLTLPLARRYTACLELLGAEHCHTVPLFPEDKITSAPNLTPVVPFSAPSQFIS